MVKLQNKHKKDLNKLPKLSIFLSIEDDDSEQTIINFLKQLNSQRNINFEILLPLKNKKILKKYLNFNSKISIINSTISNLAQVSKGDYILFATPKTTISNINLFYSKAIHTDADLIFCEEKKNSFLISSFFSGLDQRIFSPQDFSEYIFQIIPIGKYDRLYKRDFLIKNNIEDYLGNFEDVAFSVLTTITVQKISFINIAANGPVYKNILDIDRLYISYKTLEEKIYEIEKILKKNEVYNLYKQSFLNFILDTLSDLDTQNDPCLEKYKSFLIRKMDKRYSFLSNNKNYFYNEKNYIYLLNTKHPPNFSLTDEQSFYESREKVIPIIMATNEKYAKYVGITIQSIIEHANKSNLYDIFLLHTDLSTSSCNALESLSQNNIRCSCIQIHDFLPKLKLCTFIDYISKETYFRFVIPELFRGFKKVLYLDSDLIVNQDIKDLYQIELGNNLVAGVWNPFSSDTEKYIRSIPLDPKKYINAGVLILDLDKWRANKISDKCWNLVEKELSNYRYMDQDILNLVCKNRIKLLEWKWNIQYCNTQLYSEITKKDPFKEIFILHYAYKTKPWKFPTLPYMDFWWKVARNSAFYETCYSDLFLENNFNETK